MDITYLKNLLFKEKVNLLQSYYKNSHLGNSDKAMQLAKKLISYAIYEDLFLNNPLSQELLLCMKKCDTTLIAFFEFFKDLRGVNIDIIENIDPSEKDLVVY